MTTAKLTRPQMLHAYLREKMSRLSRIFSNDTDVAKCLRMLGQFNPRFAGYMIRVGSGRRWRRQRLGIQSYGQCATHHGYLFSTVMLRDENGQASVRCELAERSTPNDSSFSMPHAVEKLCCIGKEPFDDSMRETLAIQCLL